MITKEEILFFAEKLKLQPTTVEKDYALSWVLYGISNHPKMSEWLFKGGTCLKKCYFETYRFSEDLDFTVPENGIYDEQSIRLALNEVADLVYEMVGLDLKVRDIEVKESINKNNSKTYTAKYTYLGPLKLPSRNQQRIKFDITDDEIIVDSSDMRNTFHLYSDAPSPLGKVRCYSVNEILAEKTRAMYERQGRARDIYDIVNISRNFREDINIPVARESLLKKFAFKMLPIPTVDLILSRIDLKLLESSWSEQLNHQVEVLPPVASFIDDLREALSWWIDENAVETPLHFIPYRESGETLPREHFTAHTNVPMKKLGVGYPVNTILPTNLEQIRYAGRNRLSVLIEYNGVKRLVEPYSFRRPNTGNVLLYGYELAKGEAEVGSIKSYKVEKITSIDVTDTAFVPRYVVEL